MTKHKLEAKTKEEAWNEVKSMGVKHSPLFKQGHTYYVMLLETKPEQTDDKEQKVKQDGRRDKQTFRNRKRV